MPQLVEQGIAKAIDSDALTMLVEFRAVWESYCQEFSTCAANDRGKVLHNMTKSWQVFDKIAMRFGLTPSDRARLPVVPEAQADSGFEAMLA